MFIVYHRYWLEISRDFLFLLLVVVGRGVVVFIERTFYV